MILQAYNGNKTVGRAVPIYRYFTYEKKEIRGYRVHLYFTLAKKPIYFYAESEREVKKLFKANDARRIKTHKGERT